jgi:hypothetical protein
MYLQLVCTILINFMIAFLKHCFSQITATPDREKLPLFIYRKKTVRLFYKDKSKKRRFELKMRLQNFKVRTLEALQRFGMFKFLSFFCIYHTSPINLLILKKVFRPNFKFKACISLCLVFPFRLFFRYSCHLIFFSWPCSFP